MKKVLFTGGGTAGHVSVNIALIPEFTKNDYKQIYIGSKNGIEKEMISKISHIKYYSISSGKLRRYFSWENFIDPFKVLKGIIESLFIIRKEKPDFIFSKGGFVSVPVCLAGKLLNIPIFLHESDYTPGLANKINIKFANHIFTTFEDTLNYLPSKRASLIGAIVREDVYNGNRNSAYNLTGFSSSKPIILIMGGSLGSKIINEFIWKNINEIVQKYQVVHLVGKGNINESLQNLTYYKQYEFLNKELFDIFKIIDFTISRAGSNSIYEFLALNIPSILIPLGTNQSRGDQVDNAKFFEKNGFSKVVTEEMLPSKLLNEIDIFTYKLEIYKENMKKYKEQKKVINSAKEFYDKIISNLEVH